MSNYAFAKTLPDVPPWQAERRVVAALAEEGFGIISDVDVQGILNKKLGAGLRPYKILGACNPQLAHRALQAEPQIGLLLPCNVVVEEHAGGTRIAIADPKAMFELVDNASVQPIAADAEQRLRRVLDKR